jgi:hypothetical protein
MRRGLVRVAGVWLACYARQHGAQCQILRSHFPRPPPRVFQNQCWVEEGGGEVGAVDTSSAGHRCTWARGALAITARLGRTVSTPSGARASRHGRGSAINIGHPAPPHPLYAVQGLGPIDSSVTDCQDKTLWCCHQARSTSLNSELWNPAGEVFCGCMLDAQFDGLLVRTCCLFCTPCMLCWQRAVCFCTPCLLCWQQTLNYDSHRFRLPPPGRSGKHQGQYRFEYASLQHRISASATFSSSSFQCMPSFVPLSSLVRSCTPIQ